MEWTEGSEIEDSGFENEQKLKNDKNEQKLFLSFLSILSFMSLKFIINTDGGARGNPGPAGIGVVIADENLHIIRDCNKYIGEATNNVAEYKALVLALAEAQKLGADVLHINMDSELVVRQMNGQYKIKEPALKLLAQEVFVLAKKFKNVSFHHVRREQNKLADTLVNEAIDQALGG